MSKARNFCEAKSFEIGRLSIFIVAFFLTAIAASAQNAPKKPSVWDKIKQAAQQGQQSSGQQQPQQPGQPLPQQPGQKPAKQGQQHAASAPTGDFGPFKPP